MPKENKTCLGCNHFRLEDVHSGVCRVDKSVKPYPMKLHGDLCPKWLSCGQRYYIRRGWIKSKLAEQEEKNGS